MADGTMPLFLAVNTPIPIFIAGVAMAGIALYITQRSLLLILRGGLAQGRIITRKAQPHFTGGGGMTYAPLVEFVDSKGIRHQFQSRVGTSRTRKKDGDIVPVVYDPENPDKAEIRSLLALWFGPAMAWFLALACLWVSCKR